MACTVNLQFFSYLSSVLKARHITCKSYDIKTIQTILNGISFLTETDKTKYECLQTYILFPTLLPQVIIIRFNSRESNKGYKISLFWHSATNNAKANDKSKDLIAERH